MTAIILLLFAECCVENGRWAVCYETHCEEPPAHIRFIFRLDAFNGPAVHLEQPDVWRDLNADGYVDMADLAIAFNFEIREVRLP